MRRAFSFDAHRSEPPTPTRNSDPQLLNHFSYLSSQRPQLSSAPPFILQSSLIDASPAAGYILRDIS
ncbi:hypothetical protein B0H17DRAFT_1073583 [Mycena rosella]|uniref:Uncharacterized protein n=1 Tax=Mycena rosella TaxID=1033263 RepID=A0AAD7D8T8_MYCRO|nr:hypothetical protein B0H17DRAFT_1073583 [Mycena rosella]